MTKTEKLIIFRVHEFDAAGTAARAAATAAASAVCIYYVVIMWALRAPV